MDWVACIILISLYCHILVHCLLYCMINVYNHSNNVYDISIKSCTLLFNLYMQTYDITFLSI